MPQSEGSSKMAKYNEKHQEIPDPTPVEMPLGYERPESLESMIARMIQTVNVRAAKSGQVETFEESDDFETDDEPDLKSPYQMTDMEEEAPIYARPKPTPSGPKPQENTQAKPEAVPPLQSVEKAKETPVSA